MSAKSTNQWCNETIETFSNQIEEVEIKKGLKNKDVKEIKNLKMRLEEILSSDIPVLGENSKKRQSLKIVTKSLKILTKIWYDSDHNKVLYERRQKSIISMALICGREFQLYMEKSRYSQQDSEEIYTAIGDFYRYAAEAFNMQPRSITDDNTYTEKFDRVAAFSWFNYDQAHPAMDIYHAKMKSLFEDKALYSLIANLRYLLITEDQNRMRLEGYYITFIEDSCKYLRVSIEDNQVEGDAFSQQTYDFMDSFLIYLSAFCNQFKLVALGRPFDPRALQKPIERAVKAWNTLDHTVLDRNFVHSMVLAVVLVGQLFATAFKLVPIHLSQLLKCEAVQSVARIDFISEERDDLWDDLTRYVMANTTLAGGKSMILLIRQLNSRPAAMLHSISI